MENEDTRTTFIREFMQQKKIRLLQFEDFSVATSALA